MPLDAAVLTGLTRELAPALNGARIDKVQQPARDSLLLSVYTLQGAKRLLISAAGSGARLNFTDEKYENPDKPPMFCMLMRKPVSYTHLDVYKRQLRSSTPAYASAPSARHSLKRPSASRKASAAARSPSW